MQNRELHHHDYVLEIRNENERMSEAVDCFDINCVEDLAYELKYCFANANTRKRPLELYRVDYFNEAEDGEREYEQIFRINEGKLEQFTTNQQVLEQLKIDDFEHLEEKITNFLGEVCAKQNQEKLIHKRSR